LYISLLTTEMLEGHFHIAGLFWLKEISLYLKFLLFFWSQLHHTLQRVSVLK